MDWLQNLLFDENSIAHIVLLYSFVIAVGVLLGKIKFFGVSLGVTFVLFTGIVCGHFGLTGNTQILTFLQDFGLILFVFCIGLQVGPSFFSSFKKGGIAMNLVAMGIVALNIAVAVALYYGLNGRIELPMMVGILCGAVTNTPGLGAANEALSQLNYSGPQIAMGYACAYPLGVLGIIGSIIAIRYICRINLKKEEEDIAKEEAANPHLTPRMMHLEVHNEALAGKTLLQVRDSWGVTLFVRVYCRTVMSVFLIVILSSILVISCLWFVQRTMRKPLLLLSVLKLKWIGKSRILRWYPAVF
mgnify:CR=1 FL=1